MESRIRPLPCREGVPLKQSTPASKGQARAACEKQPRTRSAYCLVVLAFTWACGSVPGIDRQKNETPDGSVTENPDAGAPEWCSVRAILASKCQRCHGSPPAHGAPFELLTYEDTQTLDQKGRATFARMAAAIEQESMPAQYIRLTPPVEPLLEPERSLVLTWCASGGPLTGSEACEGAP